MSRTRVLIVHPNPHVSAMLASMLRPLPCDIEELADDRAAVRRLGPGTAAVVARVDPADPDALELLIYARRKHPEVPVVLLFLSPHPDCAREALDLGAVVLRFPPTATELRAAVGAAERPALPPPGSSREAPTGGSLSELGSAVAHAWRLGSTPSTPDRPIADPVEASDPRAGRGRVLCERCRALEAKAPASLWDEAPPPRSRPFGDVLSPGDLPPDPAAIRPLKEALEGPERQLILQALRALNWNRQETARALDINRTTLFKKMRKYGLLRGEALGDRGRTSRPRPDGLLTAGR